jgi:hypothetical protein
VTLARLRFFGNQSQRALFVFINSRRASNAEKIRARVSFLRGGGGLGRRWFGVGLGGHTAPHRVTRRRATSVRRTRDALV